jgi:aldose 1-epimerase
LHDDALHSRITSNLDHLVVFTNSTRDMVAIEPVSHVNNAMNLTGAASERAGELGVRVLAPGESMTAQMSIHIDAAP